MNRGGTPAFHLKSAGLGSAFELAIRFHVWASALRRDPTRQEICERFNVSRATGYRWLNGWKAAVGRGDSSAEKSA